MDCSRMEDRFGMVCSNGVLKSIFLSMQMIPFFLSQGIKYSIQKMMKVINDYEKVSGWLTKTRISSISMI